MSNKAEGISPKVPLVYDPTDGPYQLNKTLGETIRQNLRMLILTMPGERPMMPNFGVGLYRFLFSNVGDDTFGQIAQEIKLQIGRYMPGVNLLEVSFVTSDEDTSLKLNEVRVGITYSLAGQANREDTLTITSTMTN